MTTLRWVPARVSTGACGVALVIHGLNVSPARMYPLADCLAAAGVECLCLSLRGHGDNYLAHPAPADHTDPAAARLESFRGVSYALWRGETAAAYAIAHSRSRLLGVPLLLAGFSLGALMGCTLALTEPDVRFDRMLLFAPALALRRRSRLPRLLGRWPGAVIPSLAPAEYRANRGTPAAAYAALYRALAFFARGDLRRLDAPTLVWIDPEDELVAYAGLAALVARLPQWTLCPVAKDADAPGRKVHHLIIDAQAVGYAAWADICARVTAFVQAPAPFSR